MARRADAPMVGREEELATLDGVLQQAIDLRVCHLATVIGSGRDGEVAAAGRVRRPMGRGQVRTLRGRCLSYGEGITFWPLGEIAARRHRDDRRFPRTARTKAELDRLLADAGSGVAERLGA